MKSNSVAGAIARGLRSFFAPGMLAFLLTIPLLAMLVWGLLLAWAWVSWQAGLQTWLEGTRLIAWLSTQSLPLAGGVSGVAVFLILFVLFFPLTYLTTLLLTSVLVAPRVQSHLLKRHFPRLEKRGGGSFREGLWNSLIAGFIYVILLLASLPLWLIPGGALLAGAALAGWVSSRVLVYDLLQGVASDEERLRLRRENAGSLFLLGFLLGFLSLVPFASLFLPALATLAYGWYCFGRLEEMRAGR